MTTMKMTCYVPQCDGCEEVLESDYVQHFPSSGEAIGHATDCDWLVVGDKLYCEKCREGKGFGCQSCDDLVEKDGDRCVDCSCNTLLFGAPPDWMKTCGELSVGEEGGFRRCRKHMNERIKR